jgi:PhnB protein
MAVDPIPAGYPRVTPYLCCRGAADAIEFYKVVFDATERMRMPGDSPDNIGHAELEIGPGLVMLADEFPDHGFVSPHSLGGTPVTVHVYVADVDAVFARALAAGATPTREIEDQFYGDRSGQFVDPWGHRWSVASHVEDVSEEEMGRRMAQLEQH